MTHLIPSQRPSKRDPSIATGHTFGKNENIDRAKAGIKRVVNIPPALDMYTSTQYTSTRPNQIFGSNKNRRYLTVQNVGTVTVWIGFGSIPNLSGDNAIELNPGFEIAFDSGFVPTNDASAISTTQSKLVVLEGIISNA